MKFCRKDALLGLVSTRPKAAAQHFSSESGGLFPEKDLSVSYRHEHLRTIAERIKVAFCVNDDKACGIIFAEIIAVAKVKRFCSVSRNEVKRSVHILRRGKVADVKTCVKHIHKVSVSERIPRVAY